MLYCFIKGQKPIMDFIFPIKSKHMYGKNYLKKKFILVVVIEIIYKIKLTGFS